VLWPRREGYQERFFFWWGGVFFFGGGGGFGGGGVLFFQHQSLGGGTCLELLLAQCFEELPGKIQSRKKRQETPGGMFEDSKRTEKREPGSNQNKIEKEGTIMNLRGGQEGTCPSSL